VFNSIHRVEGVVKAVTALASAATFVLLIPMMRRWLRYPVHRSWNQRTAQLAVLPALGRF
jgi:hypothetical protein